MIKKCKRCGQEFIAKLSSQTMHAGRCPRIVKQKQKKEKKLKIYIPKQPKTRDKNEQNHTKRCQKYGLTPEQFNQMSQQQDNRCAICGSISMLVIDHSHTTTRVRGLLCNACNSGLGMFRDSVTALKSAAKYLEDSAIKG